MQMREIGLKGVCLRSNEEGDGRDLEGLAVPFGDIIDTWDGPETFDRDCEFEDVENAKLCYQHGELIGRITKSEAREDGLHIQARISDTARGRDVVQFLRDGVLDSLSVGFVPVQSERDKAGVTHRRKVRLLETSVVSWPAYEAAKITAQRSVDNTNDKENNSMTDNDKLAEELAAIKEQQRSMQAAIAKGFNPEPGPVIGGKYRSQAEYLKGLYNEEPEAIEIMNECRDFIATGDTGNTATWIADDLRLIQQRRKVMGVLTHDTLPAKGMSMEYHVVTSDTTQTSKQASEGGALPFGKVKFGTKTADIETYGGYTSLSRQTIERSTTPMLNTALKALNNAYAAATEQAARDFLYKLISDRRDAQTDPNKIDAPVALDKMTADHWAGLLLDAAEEMDDRNAMMNRLVVSKDVAKAIIGLKDSGNRFLDISGKGSDTIGSFNLTGTVGDLMRMPVQILPKAPVGTAAFLDPEAVTVWESGGPTQLSDSDTTKLVDSFSVYGYMAIAETFADGLLPIKFAGVSA